MSYQTNYQRKLAEKVERNEKKDKWTERLEAMDKIEVIETFMNNWEKKTIEYYKNINEELTNLKTEIKTFKEEHKETLAAEEKQYNASVTAEALRWQKLYPKLWSYMCLDHARKAISETGLLLKLSQMEYTRYSLEKVAIEESKIESKVHLMANNKKMKLYIQVIEKTGNIIDASNLKIGRNGDINGIVTGETASANVETISAGGYNIQCYHFRVLVKIIK
jgi:hypothetical protein